MPKPPKPPHPPQPKHPPGHRHVPSTAIASFIDRGRIEGLLAPWIPEEADRAFITRCLLDEGPAHHRGANYVLLSLLGELLAELGGERAGKQAAEGDSVAVPMRLPPHLAREADDAEFALRFPRAPLDRLAPAGSTAQEAMIDCLTDGPPQHSLANAATICLLSELLARVERKA